MTRKVRISYDQVEAGLNGGSRWWEYVGGDRYVTPINYILTCKRATGLADWKIAHDLSVDSGVKVAATTVRLWRLKGEKGR